MMLLSEMENIFAQLIVGPAARFRFTPWPRLFFVKLQRTCWIQSLRLFIVVSRASGAPYEIVK